MSKLKKRYLLSFSNDITKIRDEVLSNLDILKLEVAKKDLEERIESLSEDQQKALVVISLIGAGILAFSSDARKEVSELFQNLKDSFENRPLDVHFTMILLTEFFYFSVEPNEERYQRLMDLGHVIDKNELIGKKNSQSLLLLRIDGPLSQENKNFPLYFAYTLRHMSILKMNKFLNHQRKIFEGDFIEFVQSILTDNEEEELFIQKTKTAVERWLENNRYLGNPANKKKVLLTDSAKFNIVEEELAWLNQTDNEIIGESSFNRVMKYVKILVIDDEVAKDIKPLPKINHKGFSKKIRFSFYTIHKLLEGTKVNDNYIDFLHAVFPHNFTGEKLTTRKKFSCK